MCVCILKMISVSTNCLLSVQLHVDYILFYFSVFIVVFIVERCLYVECRQLKIIELSAATSFWLFIVSGTEPYAMSSHRCYALGQKSSSSKQRYGKYFLSFSLDLSLSLSLFLFFFSFFLSLSFAFLLFLSCSLSLSSRFHSYYRIFFPLRSSSAHSQSKIHRISIPNCVVVKSDATQTIDFRIHTVHRFLVADLIGCVVRSRHDT